LKKAEDQKAKLEQEKKGKHLHLSICNLIYFSS
jgi:hypothetical protein